MEGTRVAFEVIYHDSCREETEERLMTNVRMNNIDRRTHILNIRSNESCFISQKDRNKNLSFNRSGSTFSSIKNSVDVREIVELYVCVNVLNNCLPMARGGGDPRIYQFLVYSFGGLWRGDCLECRQARVTVRPAGKRDLRGAHGSLCERKWQKRMHG